MKVAIHLIAFYVFNMHIAWCKLTTLTILSSLLLQMPTKDKTSSRQFERWLNAYVALKLQLVILFFNMPLIFLWSCQTAQQISSQANVNSGETTFCLIWRYKRHSSPSLYYCLFIWWQIVYGRHGNGLRTVYLSYRKDTEPLYNTNSLTETNFNDHIVSL